MVRSLADMSERQDRGEAARRAPLSFEDCSLFTWHKMLESGAKQRPEPSLATTLIEIILKQQARIAELEARIARLEARLGPPKTPANSSLPPSKGYKANPDVSEPKKRGAKEGHEGKSRGRADPDLVLECRVTRCRRCGTDLQSIEQEPVGCMRWLGGICLP